MPIRPFTRKLDVYFFNLRNIVFNFWLPIFPALMAYSKNTKTVRKVLATKSYFF